MRRLSIVNVTSCWQIVQEVWSRRDQHVEAQRLGLGSKSANNRDFPGTQYMPPNLKRKTTMPDKVLDRSFADDAHTGHGFFIDHGDRPVKRRLTFDTTGGPDKVPGMGRPMMFTNRRTADAPISNIESEYTVRGHLHWLAVMKEWEWEGESNGSHVAYWHIVIDAS